MGIMISDYLKTTNPEAYKGKSKVAVLTNNEGFEAHILSYAGLIEKLFIIGADGKKVDIMLGLGDLDKYLANGSNHGSLVGRSANRTKDAKFTINGVEYSLPKNDGENNLHGGNPSFQNVFWDMEAISADEVDAEVKKSGIRDIDAAETDGVRLKYTSPDGACGFPGNLETEVIYAWLEDATLLILYKGTSDKDTVFAPTNHAYFNIAGHNSGNVGKQILTINAEQIAIKGPSNVPEGEYMDVEGTIFDFREGAPVAAVLTTDHPMLASSLGIDHNYCLMGEEGKLDFAASIMDPKTGTVMECLTDLPGLQVYAGNHLGGNDQKGDKPYKPYDGICLEAQMYPNAVNVPEFDSPVIKAGETCYHACAYRFV